MMQQLRRRLLFASLSIGLRGLGRAFLRSTRNAPTLSQQTLHTILRVNGDTVFGRKRGLSGPRALEAFQELLPTTYDDYAQYVLEMAEGRQGVLSLEPVAYFFNTTGTTAAQKLIPVTRRQSKAVIKHMFIPLGLALQSGVLGPLRGRWLHLMMLAPAERTPGGFPLRVSGHMAAEQLGPIIDSVWSSSLPIYRIMDHATSLYLHFLAALAEERLWCIVSQFPSTLLEGFRSLHTRAPALLRDLADGTLPKDLALSVADRSALAERLTAKPGRARALERLLSQDRFTASEIWPDLRAVLTAGSGVQRFYTDQLMPYLGDASVFSPVYGAAEGVIGVAQQADRLGYIVSPRSAYVEFLPLDEGLRSTHRPRSIDEVDAGQLYEILLTTYSGFWRYRLGDVVKVLGWHERAPVIDFVERKGQLLNIASEKVTEANVAESFERACRTTGGTLVDYIVTIDSSASPMRYLLLIEPFAPTNRSDAQELLRAFEGELQETCWYYRELRHHGTLGAPGMLLLPSGSFDRYRKVRAAQGGIPSQVKVPHIISDPGFASRYFEGAPRLELTERNY